MALVQQVFMTKSTSRSNISVLQHNDCCGCKVCGDSCPKSAITFQKDKEGFLYPEVNENCVSCGLCVSVCPELNHGEKSAKVGQEFIGCLDKDVQRRNTGSSGGVFGLLASHLIKEGYTIYGAAFDEKLKLHHAPANTAEELEKLKKSKYIQCDSSGIYKQIKRLLAQGEKVMFVGTPCQCNALKNYIGANNDASIFIVDFACHGVPSQDLFDKCIKYYEAVHHCKVLNYGFRHKSKRYGSPQNYVLTIQKGDKILQKEGKYYEEPFYCGFQKYITLRPSCYRCKWANLDRVGNLTLADFWGIETVTKKWNRSDHPSLVILNSDKGRQLFKEIEQDLESIIATREDAVRVNKSLISPTKKTASREILFDDLIKEPFDVVVKRHLSVKHRWVRDVYYGIPFCVRKLILNIAKKL